MEVEEWVKRARKPRFALVQAGTYTDRWTKWWDSCNPEWRTRDGAGHLERGGDGNWSTMAKPGPNGFVLVIGALVGLLIAADVDVWARNMLDVLWVLQEAWAAHKG